MTHENIYICKGRDRGKKSSFTFSNAARRTWAWPVTSTTTAKIERAVLVKPWKQHKHETTPNCISVCSQFLNRHLFYFHLLLQFKTFLILSSCTPAEQEQNPTGLYSGPHTDMPSLSPVLQTIPLCFQRLERESKTKCSVGLHSPLKFLFLITWIDHRD